ncbi:MAG: HAMP domain-containing histidine kinase [Actinomycetaceae bacterium]|nr:HAMP domain-containing histidine kinase [Actinomycetaceae bacterium]
MNPSAAATTPSAPANQPRGLFDVLARYFKRIRTTWISSLTLRTITLIVVGSVIAMMLTGAIIVNQIKSAVYSQTVSLNIEQFATDAQIAQDRFGVTSSPTTAQSQRIALELVSSMYDPARGLIGAVLLRSPGQVNPDSAILEPATATTTKVRSLVTDELREAVRSGDHIAWQSVAIANPDGSTQPGIVIGTQITVPASGTYELYAAYSMQTQEDLLGTTFRALALAMVGLIVIISLISWIVMSLVLKPIRAASQNARLLTEGDFNSRMVVHGSDELAQLGKSFNTMAESLEEQFTRLERMSAIQTDFVSAVSHELRTPVTTIRMAGQLIYDKREDLPPALKRSAELQHSQLNNLDAMLSDLLEISRYDAGGMSLVGEKADIAEIARQVIKLSEPLALDNGVIVELDVTGDTEAEVEPLRVERIIRNLVVNALEHAEGRPVKVSIVGGRTAIAVQVQDHGVGISPEQAKQVFERFWRADSSRVRKSGGTGLGLTIAREDALIHGGKLEATGELGVGSTFLLTLPRSPGAAFTKPLALEPPQPYVIPELEPASGAVSEPEPLLVDSGVAAASEASVATAVLIDDETVIPAVHSVDNTVADSPGSSDSPAATEAKNE